MNDAISGLGRLISDDPADRDVAEVIWAALRGMVLAQMIIVEPIDWQRERRTLVEMATQLSAAEPVNRSVTETTRRARWSRAASGGLAELGLVLRAGDVADAVGVAVGELQRVGVPGRHDDAAEMHQ